MGRAAVASAIAGVEQNRRQSASERFENAVELPLVVLALAMVPLLVLPLVLDLPTGVETTFVALDWFIWAAFTFDYVVHSAGGELLSGWW